MDVIAAQRLGNAVTAIAMEIVAANRVHHYFRPDCVKTLLADGFVRGYKTVGEN